MSIYREAQRNIIARGTVANGYFGERASVAFALVRQCVLVVAECGCYRAGLPDVLGAGEAVWMLRNHPSARHITVTS